MVFLRYLIFSIVVFQGTEQPLSNLASRLEGKHWDFVAVGFGMRGFRNGTATARFEGKCTTCYPSVATNDSKIS